MAPISSTQFVDTALHNTGPQALSYIYCDYIWIIRDHLLSLLRDFPSLVPSVDVFTYDDGTSARLLNACGHLLISPNSPPIYLTIWVHQSYPFSAPLVFLTSTSSTAPIAHPHPFVNRSGMTTSPYLQTWLHPTSNLSGLARNLVHLFTHHPPFLTSPSPSFRSNHSLASPREAMDRLVGALHYDLTSLQSQIEEEVEELSNLQTVLKNRAHILSNMESELSDERCGLKRRVTETAKEADALQIWLRVNGSCSDMKSSSQDDCDAFEASDERSAQILENVAADHGIEDLVDVLDKALVEGLIPFPDYLKQIRSLVREQFFHRAFSVQFK